MQWLPFSFKKYTFKSYAINNILPIIVLKNIHLRAMQWLPLVLKNIHLRAMQWLIKNIHLRAMQWLPYSFKKYTFKSYAMTPL